MIEQRIIELLTRKLAGEISSDELSELKELMSDYNEANQIQEITDEIWNHRVEEIDAMFFYEKHRLKHNHRFQPTIREETIPSSADHAFPSRNYRPLVFMTCGLTALALISYLFFSHDRPKRQAVTEIVAGKGIRKQITLADGTKVWLNGDSQLSYNAFDGKSGQRLVNLNGEAFFEVAQDKHHPFVVKAKKFSIKVLGTAFNVNVYSDSKKSETSLISGSLELNMNDGSRQAIVLKPNEKITLDQNGKTSIMTIARMSDPKYIPETSWKDNKLVFNNEPMTEVAKKLERWYNVHVAVNVEIGANHFTGAFENSSIEQTLKAMQQIKPFNYDITDHEVVIY